jgi:uncharacterized protein
MYRSRIVVPALVVLTTLVAPSSVLLGGRAAAAAAAVGSAPFDQPRDGVLVTGTGEVFGTPDTLTANFGVEAGAATVGEALERATTAAGRMRDALVRAGVARADLQTSNVGISTERNDKQEITGYAVSQGLTAKIRNMPQAGALMSAAIAAGGDAARLNGVSFAIEDDAALLAEARRRAFADAREKAELYARAAGRPLGRVVTVSEGTPGYRGSGEQNMMAAADSVIPVEPGRQQLTVTVTVEWAFRPATGAAEPSGLG